MTGAGRPLDVARPAPARSVAAKVRLAAWTRPGLAAAVVVAPAFLLALLLRATFLDRGYDIFVDEITYLRISQSIVAGHGITLYGSPFFLHPPLFFLIEGAVSAAAGLDGGLIQQVLAIRGLNAVLGAATAVALLLVAWRAAGLRIALVAYALFAIDPFIVRLNSRNLLETSALLWVILGYLVLSWRVRAGRIAPNAGQVVGAGVLFGLATLTKDTTSLLTVVPLLLLGISGRLLPRRQAFAIAGIAALTYSIYPLVVAVDGLGPAFAAQKLGGLLRFLGVAKTTGFVASGGPSFASAITRNLDVFVTTYTLIALGIPSCLLLLARGSARARLLGLLSLCSLGSLTYSVLFGTLEEQFFYFLVGPALLSVPIAWSMLVRWLAAPDGWLAAHGEWLAAHGGWLRGRDRIALLSRLLRTAVPVALGVSLAWSGLVWLEVHTQRDDGYAQMEAWMRDHVRNGSRIGVTTDPQQFVLQGYVINVVTSAADVTSTGTQYVAVSTKQIEEGYTRNGRALYAWVRGHGLPIWVFDGRTYGRLELYRITP